MTQGRTSSPAAPGPSPPTTPSGGVDPFNPFDTTTRDSIPIDRLRPDACVTGPNWIRRRPSFGRVSTCSRFRSRGTSHRRAGSASWRRAPRGESRTRYRGGSWCWKLGISGSNTGSPAAKTAWLRSSCRSLVTHSTWLLHDVGVLDWFGPDGVSHINLGGPDAGNVAAQFLVHVPAAVPTAPWGDLARSRRPWTATSAWSTRGKGSRPKGWRRRW